MVRGGGLEPPHREIPEPKSGKFNSFYNYLSPFYPSFY